MCLDMIGVAIPSAQMQTIYGKEHQLLGPDTQHRDQRFATRLWNACVGSVG